MDMELDERLVRRHLLSPDNKAAKVPEALLHIRRTLDQSYFLHLKDTTQRDRDQVVYRATKKQGNLARVVMVDQLWLWILDERTFVPIYVVHFPCLFPAATNHSVQTRSSHPSLKGGDAISRILLGYIKAFETAWLGRIAKSCRLGTLVSIMLRCNISRE